MRTIDKVDRLLLTLLQRNGHATNQQLAGQANLSAAPCWRRIKKLEKDGLIDHYTAILHPKKLGLDVVAYIHISLETHHPENINEFTQFVADSSNILECSSVSGNHDFLLKIIIKNVEQLEIFLMKELLNLKSVKSANTSIVLQQHKSTTILPLD